MNRKVFVVTKKKIIFAFGGFICAVLCLAFIKPAASTVFNTIIAKAERKLPIYCVDTDEKKLP